MDMGEPLGSIYSTGLSGVCEPATALLLAKVTKGYGQNINSTIPFLCLINTVGLEGQESWKLSFRKDTVNIFKNHRFHLVILLS